MSRQSLAVKSSGALIGTWPVATTLPLTLMVMSSGPAGLGLGVGRLDLDLSPCRRAAARLARIFVRWMMKRLYS